MQQTGAIVRNMISAVARLNRFEKQDLALTITLLMIAAMGFTF